MAHKNMLFSTLPDFFSSIAFFKYHQNKMTYQQHSQHFLTPEAALAAARKDPQLPLDMREYYVPLIRYLDGVMLSEGDWFVENMPITDLYKVLTTVDTSLLIEMEDPHQDRLFFADRLPVCESVLDAIDKAGSVAKKVRLIVGPKAWLQAGHEERCARA